MRNSDDAILPPTVPENRPDADRAPRGGRLVYGPWTVDLVGGLLERDGRETRLTRRTAAVFRVLVAHAGETVTREALIQQVWPDSYPTDDVVTKAIRELRQALGDDPRGGQFVETIPRVGYRLTGPFTQPAVPAAVAAPAVEIAEGAAPEEAASAPIEPAPPPATPAPGSRLVWIGLALTVVALAAIAWFAPRAASERGGTAGRGGAATFAVPELQRALVERIRPLTALPGAELLGTLSPDGRVLAYSARDSLSAPFRIYIAPVETLERRLLSPNAPAEATELVPEWSPDGRTIAFQRVIAGDCSVFIATSSSRSQRRLTGCQGLFAQHHAFTPDGKYLAILRPLVAGGPTRLHLMALDTGATEPLAYDIPHDPWESDVEARFSADGRFVAVRRGRAPYGGLYVVDLVQKTVKPVVEHSRVLGGFDWLPDSRTLLLAAGYGTPSALWLYHEPNGSLEYVGTTSLRRPRFARRARLAVFAQSTVDSVVSRFSLEGDATPNVPVRTYESTYSEEYPAREHAGDRTAFVSSRAGSPQLFVSDDAEGEVQQVTHFDAGAVTWPRWRPDGSEIVFVHSNDDHDALHVVRVGDSWTRELDAGLERVQRADFSPDGEWIYYDGLNRGTWETWRMHRDGGARERVAEGAFGPLSAPTAVGGVVAVDPVAGAFVHVDAEGTRRTLAAGRLHDWNRWAWDTGDAGIYFVWGSRLDDFGLYLQPWDGSEPRLVVRVPRLLPSFGLSVDERARFALVGQSASDEADLVLLDLHTTARGPR
ncbi:MAG TPA: winged helix-turn-helix domain-containing protein [Xanthomonadales bacterium]|nr:winged helix-turn-helix domain-containing protein [Xanthomonadales bacterium]